MNIFKKYKKVIFVVLILGLILTACDFEAENVATSNNNINDEDLIVHFIDVGQGDSIFIRFPNGETTLIDGGTKKSGDYVVKYLKGLDIEKIDYLIATHPHEDHIGGLPKVIKNFQIGKIYMPNKTANTSIFEEFLLAIKESGLNINTPKGGDIILSNDDLKYEILAPNGEDYSKTNDFSIVTKITYRENSFLFTGDAEEKSETEMIEKGFNLSSDVLKIGHHGGSTSTTEEFLIKVNPKYGVISLGSNNTYGHPHRETIDKLKKHEVTILRTDELGNIVMVSNGKDIKLLNKNEINNENEDGEYFIGNINTKVYHSSNCSQLPNKENRIIFKSKVEAEENGYKPHGRCVE